MYFFMISIVGVLLFTNGSFCLWNLHNQTYWFGNNDFKRVFEIIYTIGLYGSLFTSGYLLLQAFIAQFYRPKKLLKDSSLYPSCTILIPAFNEGKQVYDTIKSVLQSDYPEEKMEVIAIDDGSQDDTWQWICSAVADFPNRVRGIRQPANGGKKKALCRGIQESTNEIIVTVDSDSMLETNAIRNLLCPFPQDAKIGAVAGNIRVRNYKSGILRKMMDVCFVFGCDFLRSAQSVTGYVLCTPGAISAYRRSAISPLLSAWLSQTFLGIPATIGEDRALTSLLLCNNWKVVCQNTAVAWTESPGTYSKLCKMLLRWARGDARESLLLQKHIWTHWSFLDWRRMLFQLNVISQLVGILLPLLFIPCTIMTLVFIHQHWWQPLLYIIAINGIWSILPATVYVRRAGFSGFLWAFVFSIFNLVGLSWICIYSLLTLQNSQWMTRKRKISR